MKPTLVAICAAVLSSACAVTADVTPPITGGAQVGATVAADRTVTINYSGMPGNAQDWINLVPATASDETYGDWEYTRGNRSGTVRFTVRESGRYEVRTYFDWPTGGFTVRSRTPVVVP